MAMEPMPGMAADEPLRTTLAGVGRAAPISSDQEYGTYSEL